jgi:HmuY protein
MLFQIFRKGDSMRISTYLVMAASLLAIRCAADLQSSDGGTKSSTTAAPVTTTLMGDGTFKTVIDATSLTAWRYFNFETSSEATVSNPQTDNVWDLGFQRFMIRLNSGVSGTATAAVQLIAGSAFNALTQSPVFTTPLVDVADAGDGNDACRPTTAGVLYAFLKSTNTPNACWLYYTGAPDHQLLSRKDDVAYVVRTNTPKYYKVQVLSYYGSTGTSGIMSFRWAEVIAP